MANLVLESANVVQKRTEIVSQSTLAGVSLLGATPLQGYSWENDGIVGLSYSSGGVYGGTSIGAGVYALSSRGVGIVGETRARPPYGYAGVFVGPVWVQGDLICDGAKHAAVPHPDGSLRLMYSVESPESWFEDFGTAKLIRGRAKVKIDRHFAALMRSGRYHVFLTAEGDCAGLYVTRKGSAGFEVREQRGGSSNVRFSYRVVARRKDISGPRLPKVQRPQRPRASRYPQLRDLTSRSRGRSAPTRR